MMNIERTSHSSRLTFSNCLATFTVTLPCAAHGSNDPALEPGWCRPPLRFGLLHRDFRSQGIRKNRPVSDGEPHPAFGLGEERITDLVGLIQERQSSRRL